MATKSGEIKAGRTLRDPLTKAVEDVVKVIEIVVAVLYLGLIVHCVVDKSVGISHRAGADEGHKRAGGSGMQNKA